MYGNILCSEKRLTNKLTYPNSSNYTGEEDVQPQPVVIKDAKKMKYMRH